MEKEINSIEEYFEIIFNIQKEVNDKNIWKGFMHRNIALGGQENKKFDLLPSIGRRRPASHNVSILDQERSLIKVTKYKLPYIFNFSLSLVD